MKHAATDVSTQEFADMFGNLLRETRGRRRLRHYASFPFTSRELRAAERGGLPLDPALVNALASRYGLDLGVVFPPRHAVAIGDGVIAANGDKEPFDPADEGSVYDAFLTLIRRLRGLPDGDTIVLRSEDIALLADVVSRPYVHVLHELGSRMGLARQDRIAMAEMLVGGADVAGLATSAS